MGVESLFGPLALDWEVTTLGEACRRGGGEIQTGPFGSQLHASDYVPFGIPSIMPQNIGDNRVVTEGIAGISREDATRLSRYLVRPGDIVYSRRGDVEKRALIRESEAGWLCGTGCLRVRLGEGPVDPRYASYYLGHPEVRAWISRHAIGATMPNLNTSILSALPFVIPPLSEQRAIASILGALDDKIELNRRMNETLEAMARAIFKSWFVDFDPVRAKAEGRHPPGVDRRVGSLFPNSLVDSPLGEIPEGWRIGKLREVLSISRDSLDPGECPAEVFDHYSIPAFDEGQIPKAETGEQIKSNKFIVPGGAVLLSRLNPRIPRVWLPQVSGSRRSVCSTEYLVALPEKGFAREYLYSFFGSTAFLEVFGTLVTGTSGSHQRVKAEYVPSMDAVIPREALIGSYSELVTPLFVMVSANREQSRTLAAMRDVLLRKLVSGEIRVKDAEQFVEAEL
jgi:type I restriction enzyme S subunit